MLCVTVPEPPPPPPDPETAISLKVNEAGSCAKGGGLQALAFDSTTSYWAEIAAKNRNEASALAQKGFETGPVGEPTVIDAGVAVPVKNTSTWHCG